VVNFAQADLYVLGGFLGYAGSRAGLSWWLTLGASAACVTGVAALEERVAVRPIARRLGGSDHADLITTLGASVVIGGVIIEVWGPHALSVPSPGPGEPLDLFGGRVTAVDLTLIAVAVVTVALLEWFTRRSRFGLAVLAQAEDRESATLLGVNVTALSVIAFAAAGFCAGLLGPLIAMKTFAAVSLALVLAVKAFVVMVLGGSSSYLGALIGGLLVGLVEALTALHLGGQYTTLATFVVFLCVVLIRPQGILGGSALRSV
jgi:branched-chain amino acid transport system permease protein